jgi:hypothetical protein
MWRADASITAGVYNTERQIRLRAASAELWDSRGSLDPPRSNRSLQGRVCLRQLLTRDPQSQLFEYACHEGNEGMRNMLKAARDAEKKPH